MVKAIGYGGYREFRYALVAEEARRNTEEQGTVEPMYGYSPVSYTHLDVYKRQGVHLSGSGEGYVCGIRFL